jgi:hypothetical protein
VAAISRTAAISRAAPISRTAAISRATAISILPTTVFLVPLFPFIGIHDIERTADLFLLDIRMNHVVNVLVHLFSVDEDIILIYEAGQIDQLELLEFLGSLLIRLNHGRTYEHDHHDTIAEDQLDHHLDEGPEYP